MREMTQQDSGVDCGLELLFSKGKPWIRALGRSGSMKWELL